MRIAVLGLTAALAAALAVAACDARETPWEATPDPAARAAVVEAAAPYGEQVLVALREYVPTAAFDTPGRTLDRAIRATDTWWVVAGPEGDPRVMVAFTAADGEPAELAGSDWTDPEGLVAAAAVAGDDPRLVHAWGHVVILGDGADGIVAVPVGAGPVAAQPVPIAAFSDQLRDTSRGGGLGFDPWVAAALAALFALGVAFPVLVLAGRAIRRRRR